MRGKIPFDPHIIYIYIRVNEIGGTSRLWRWAACSKIEERRKDLMDYVKAFVVGGIICAIVQILMEKTKLMPGRIMVMLVCTGALLGAVGIYGPFSKWAGAGANVPLLGFGNVLWKGVKEAVDSEGFIGLFKGGFKACAVGVSAALIFSYIAALITKPKLKS